MPNAEHYFFYGVAALVALILLYYLWPYLIGFLAVVGADQIYRVWRHHSGPGA